MITLADAQKLSQSKLTSFIIDEFRKSALLDSLPFDNCVIPQGGNTMAYVYNRVTTPASAAVRALGVEYVPQNDVKTPYTVNLKVFGGSFNIDRVVAENQTQLVNLIQDQIVKKTTATKAKFHDLFVNGDSGVDPLEFDGLDKALTGSNTELVPAAPIDLSSSANIDSNWKVFLDVLRKMRATLDGAPSLFMLNSDMFAVYQSVMDRAGINLASKANFGDEVLQWGSSLIMSMGDKPGTSNPIIPTDAGGETSIYAARLSLDGVHGVSPAGNAIVKQFLPDMNAPGAVKLGEVEMVAAMAIKATRSAGVLRKIKIQ